MIFRKKYGKKGSLSKMLWVIIDITLAVAFILFIVLPVYNWILSWSQPDEGSVATYRNMIDEVYDSMVFVENKNAKDNDYRTETFSVVMDVQPGVSIEVPKAAALVEDAYYGSICITKVKSSKYQECQQLNAQFQPVGVVYQGKEALGKMTIIVNYNPDSDSFQVSFKQEA